MLYLIYALLIIIGIINKKSKTIFYIIQCFIVFLIITGNTGNEDRIYYKINYSNIQNNLKTWDFEGGYQLLNKIGIKLGLSYDQFLCLIIVIALILISSTIMKFTKNISFVISLYLLYPFIWDTVQIRNFLAMAIIIFGLRYIICYDKSYMKFIICVLIASTMHITSLFYLSFLLVKVKNTKKLFVYCMSISLISIFLMPSILKAISLFIPAYKLQAYMGTQTSILTKVFVVTYYCLLLIIVNYTIKLLNKNLESSNRLMDENKKEEAMDCNAILKINIILMLAMYFLINNLDFIRMYRNIYIIDYILFSVALIKLNKSKKYYIYTLSVLAFILVSFVVFIIYVPTTNIVKPLFDSNFILN